MEMRPLGRSGLQVSRLALGTMTWGRDTDEHEARDQLLAFRGVEIAAETQEQMLERYRQSL